jgi:hypothetical protein
MLDGFEIPPFRVAEVFVDDRCVGLLSDVKLSREETGGYNLEGNWSGYSNVLGNSPHYTISIPRYECKFLAVKVDAEPGISTGRVQFKNASFLPDGPGPWIEKPGEA